VSNDPPAEKSRSPQALNIFRHPMRLSMGRADYLLVIGLSGHLARTPSPGRRAFRRLNAE
jgi:hypothetical protein